ncbi:hypothetical protein TNCV_2549541 [Trichonephila clavipes]|nr:hypothetical protein TNCV_2549541 [Trichonephila clavipes]
MLDWSASVLKLTHSVKNALNFQGRKVKSIVECFSPVKSIDVGSLSILHQPIGGRFGYLTRVEKKSKAPRHCSAQTCHEPSLLMPKCSSTADVLYPSRVP